jgi:hypothetical protein
LAWPSATKKRKTFYDVDSRTGTRAGTTGLFPSLVVEDSYDNGEDSPDDYSLASPLSSVAPPSFSPPRVPSAMIPKEEPKTEEQPGTNIIKLLFP